MQLTSSGERHTSPLHDLDLLGQAIRHNLGDTIYSEPKPAAASPGGSTQLGKEQPVTMVRASTQPGNNGLHLSQTTSVRDLRGQVVPTAYAYGLDVDVWEGGDWYVKHLFLCWWLLFLLFVFLSLLVVVIRQRIIVTAVWLVVY